MRWSDRAVIAMCAVLSACDGGAWETKGNEIVEKMIATYARATTYTDHGRVIVDGSEDREAEFRTAFSRQSRTARVVHHDSRDLVLWVRRRDALLTLDDSLITRDRNRAIKVAERMTHGASRTILDLLMEHPQATLATLVDLRLDGVDTVDGITRWRVTGRGRRGGSVTLWIEDGTWIVRRVRWRKGWFGVGQKTFEYKAAALDGVVTDHELRAPARWWIGIGLSGNRINHVYRGTPAFLNGLQVNDELISIDGEAVADPADAARITNRSQGRLIEVVVLRGGARVAIRLIPVYQY